MRTGAWCHVVLSALLLFGVGGTSFAQGGKKVVVMGDFLSVPDAEGKSWVDALSAKQADVRVVNASDKTRKATDTDALKAIADANKDASTFLILLGMNNLRDEQSGVTVEACRNGLDAVAAHIRSVVPAATVVICAPPGVVPEKFTPVWSRKARFGLDTVTYVKRLSLAYRILAGERRLGYIETSGAVSTENRYDGVNLSPAGYSQLADAVSVGLASPGLVPAKYVPPPEETPQAPSKRWQDRLDRRLVIGVVAVLVLFLSWIPFFLADRKAKQLREELSKKKQAGKPVKSAGSPPRS